MHRLTQVCSSDRQSEFGEGCCEAKAWRGVGGEFVVAAAAAEVLHERVAGGDPGGRLEALESAHGP
jgi:hypothetical protein